MGNGLIPNEARQQIEKWCKENSFEIPDRKTGKAFNRAGQKFPTIKVVSVSKLLDATKKEAEKK